MDKSRDGCASCNHRPLPWSAPSSVRPAPSRQRASAMLFPPPGLRLPQTRAPVTSQRNGPYSGLSQLVQALVSLCILSSAFLMHRVLANPKSLSCFHLELHSERLSNLSEVTQLVWAQSWSEGSLMPPLPPEDLGCGPFTEPRHGWDQPLLLHTFTEHRI